MVGKDATGMPFAGRRPDGRYLYRVLGTGWGYHEVALTHEQRVRFARLRALVANVRPGSQLWPANLRTCLGRGAIRGHDLWLPVDADLSESTARTIAHEFCHLDGLDHGHGFTRSYAKPWQERQAHWAVKLALATKNWTAWPEVQGLRDSIPPQQRAARAREAREERSKAETSEQRWARKREHAARMLADWERRTRLAERRAAKWRRALRLAERKLKAQGQPPVAIAASKP